MSSLGPLGRSIDRATRPPLLAWIAALLFALLASVCVAHVLRLELPRGGNIQTGTGDFLAFWTGAVAIHEGSGASLYDYHSQREIQSRILGGTSPAFQPYLNPPLLAVSLAPFVPLGFLAGFHAYGAACLLALATGILALCRLLPALVPTARSRWTLALLVAGFQPMLETALGGQNTPITFALLACFAVAMNRGSAVVAALALGLLTYKPQYALGFGLALAIAGQWRIAAGGALLGIAHWAVGARWCGWDWPLRMLDFFSVYRPMELRDNATAHFSLVRTADLLLPPPLDILVTVAGVTAVLAAWWRYRDLARHGDPRWTALVVAGTMLGSPHLQYYDVALLVLPVSVLLADAASRGEFPGLVARTSLALLWVGYPAWRIGPALGFQPLLLPLVTVWVLLALRCEAAVGRPTPPRSA